jgi:hypothetical protein
VSSMYLVEGFCCVEDALPGVFFDVAVVIGWMGRDQRRRRLPQQARNSHPMETRHRRRHRHDRRPRPHRNSSHGDPPTPSATASPSYTPSPASFHQLHDWVTPTMADAIEQEHTPGHIFAPLAAKPSRPGTPTVTPATEEPPRDHLGTNDPPRR